MLNCYQNWSDESLMQDKDDNDLCKGQRSRHVKRGKECSTATNMARRITKQVKDDDDLYKGKRSTEVI